MVFLWTFCREGGDRQKEMESSTANGSKQTTSLEAIKRRQVGKREWKNMIQEVLDSEKADLLRLRKLRVKHRDAETQELISELTEALAERVIKLTELYHYKDTEAVETNGGQ